MLVLTKDQVVSIDDWYNHGEKINAIKQVREITGLGLKEAKDIIDDWPMERARIAQGWKNPIGPGKMKYIASRENYTQTLLELGSIDFDEENLNLLKEDLNLCSEHLLRWLAYRLSVKETSK